MPFRVKQIVVAILYRLDQFLPHGIDIYARNRCWPWKPALDAVELHLADRCNMNCTGCSHFSPFADEWQADASRIADDLSVLMAKFPGGIRHVNLLGGEPLLHRDVCGVIECVRVVCPKAKITIVTNGLLLLSQNVQFWNTCRRARVHLNLTLYGPMKTKRRAIVDKCSLEHVPLRVQERDVFFARMVPDGSSNPTRAFRFCRRTTYCPYLREGRLYICAQAYHIRDFAREASKSGLPNVDGFDEGLDIRQNGLSWRNILDYLMRPGKVCRFCSDSLRLMEWGNDGSRNIVDWLRYRVSGKVEAMREAK